MKAPDKEFYSAQRNEDLVDLNLAKTRRENQFKEKRVVDADLRNVNQEIQTKVQYLYHLGTEHLGIIFSVEEPLLTKIVLKPIHILPRHELKFYLNG